MPEEISAANNEPPPLLPTPAFERVRTNSVKRKKTSESGIDCSGLTFDKFLEITDITKKIADELDLQCITAKGNKNDKDKFISPIKSWLSELESKLTDVARLTFSMAASNAVMKERLDKIEATIACNVATGDLVSDIERSAKYKDFCDETMNSNLLIKVPNLELGASENGEELPILDTIKKKLANTLPENSLKDIIITPLAKKTIEKDGKFVIPILLKAKTKTERDSLDKKLKNHFDTNFHWPKPLFPIVKSIRSQMLELKNEKIDLTNKQIMIRPSSTGRSLTISFRDGFRTKWQLLESVKTPAPKFLLDNTKFTQPCNSKFLELKL